MNMHNKKIFLTFLFFNSFIINFFRPTAFWDTSYWAPPVKINKPTGFALKTRYGATSTGQDNEGNKKNVLNLYGDENLHVLARSIPQEVLDRFPESILNLLHEEAKTPGLGELRVTGKFNLYEAHLDFFSGITKHWSFGFAANFFKVKINNINYTDQTPTSSIPSSIGESAWRNFFDNFAENMNKYGLHVPEKSVSTLIKELEFVGSYAQQYKTVVGLLRWSFVFGVAIPIIRETESVLALSHGYGDPKEVPFSFSASLEPTKCFTAGFTGGGSFLLSQKREVGMFTHSAQNGLIKLGRGDAKVNYGTFVTIGMFSTIKFKEYWTLMAAYKYNHKTRAHVTPEDTTTFDVDIVNHDPILNSWTMRVLNLALEYEQEKGNRVIKAGLSIDMPLNGRNNFDTKMFGTGFYIAYHW